MSFPRYIVSDKHRNKKPTKDASIWTICEWTEIQLFGQAGKKNWRSQDEGHKYIWAVKLEADKLLQLGVDESNKLYFAKFKSKSNNEWHGYPIHPRGNDIPPEAILELWRTEELIDKADKRRIQQGKF